VAVEVSVAVVSVAVVVVPVTVVMVVSVLVVTVVVAVSVSVAVVMVPVLVVAVLVESVMVESVMVESVTVVPVVNVLVEVRSLPSKMSRTSQTPFVASNRWVVYFKRQVPSDVTGKGWTGSLDQPQGAVHVVAHFMLRHWASVVSRGSSKKAQAVPSALNEEQTTSFHPLVPFLFIDATHLSLPAKLLGSSVNHGTASSAGMKSAIVVQTERCASTHSNDLSLFVLVSVTRRKGRKKLSMLSISANAFRLAKCSRLYTADRVPPLPTQKDDAFASPRKSPE
jgi:hypothetical protein